MTVNTDPRPGRWILPLVILAMVGFTYFFVRELPAASADSTLAGETTTTTSVSESPGTTQPPDGAGLDPEVQTYLDAVDDINGESQLLGVEMVTVNDGFDADPREITYEETEARMEGVVNDTQTLSDRLAELTAPTGLQPNQDALTTAMQFVTLAAGDALNGLRSTDTGELRRNAVEAYMTALGDLDTEVANTHNAAGSSG